MIRQDRASKKTNVKDRRRGENQRMGGERKDTIEGEYCTYCNCCTHTHTYIYIYARARLLRSNRLRTGNAQVFLLLRQIAINIFPSSKEAPALNPLQQSPYSELPKERNRIISVLRAASEQHKIFCFPAFNSKGDPSG